MKLRPWFSLPLLGKELLDLSARPRTYLVRMAYATLLMLISFLVLQSAMPAGATPREILGSGLAVMLGVGYAQQIGLQVVLPAVTCGVFTVEKERNTLGLLFLTKLGPWTILFEKFLSRLLLAWSFVVISAPALAFCYGLGGITIDVLLAQILSLLVSSLAIVSISILCSTYFRTTSSALMASYVAIFCSRALVQVGLYSRLLNGRIIRPDELLRSVILQGGISIDDAPFPPGTFSPLYATLLLSLPWLLLSLLCLRLARRYLVTCAFISPSNLTKIVLGWLDRMYERANRNPVTRGIVVLRPTVRLPGNDPVAWRETTTRSLGQARYLFRIMLLVEIPTLVVLGSTKLTAPGEQGLGTVLVVQTVLWVGLTLFTCVLSAGLIAGERSRQTLDTLLVTPLASREIVRQKMAGVMRLIWICEVPLWTCLVFRFGVDGNVSYFLIQAAMLWIYPRLVAWIGMSHGLRSKTAMVAVVKSLLDVMLRCLVPYLLFSETLAIALEGVAYGSLRQLFSILSLCSPLTLLIATENTPALSSNIWVHNLTFNTPVAFVLNTAFHAWMLGFISSRCLDRADLLLGRKKAGADPDA